MGSMVGTGRSARLIKARDRLDIDRFGSEAELAGLNGMSDIFPKTDIGGAVCSVGFAPIGDLVTLFDDLVRSQQ